MPRKSQYILIDILYGPFFKSYSGFLKEITAVFPKLERYDRNLDGLTWILNCASFVSAALKTVCKQVYFSFRIAKCYLKSEQHLRNIADQFLVVVVSTSKHRLNCCSAVISIFHELQETYKFIWCSVMMSNNHVNSYGFNAP